MSTVEQGRVKWFDTGRGFGFLRTPAGDLFVHINDVEGEFLPAKGDKVEYQRGTTRDGREIGRRVKIIMAAK